METSDDTIRENPQKNTVGSTLKSLWRNRTKIGGTLLFLAMTGPYGFAALIAFYALKNTVKGLLKMKLEYDLKTATEQAKHRQNEIRRAYQGGGEAQTAAPSIGRQEETHGPGTSADLPLPVAQEAVVQQAEAVSPDQSLEEAQVLAAETAQSVREQRPGEPPLPVEEAEVVSPDQSLEEAQVLAAEPAQSVTEQRSGEQEMQTAERLIEGQVDPDGPATGPDLPLPVAEPLVVPEAEVALPLEAVDPARTITEREPGQPEVQTAQPPSEGPATSPDQSSAVPEGEVVGPAQSVREQRPGEQSEQTTTPLNSEQSEAQDRAINPDPPLPGSETQPAMESGPTIAPQEQSLVSKENKEASTDKTEVSIEDIQRQFDASPNNLERLRHSDLRALVVVQPTALAIQNKHDSNTTISLKPTTMVPRGNNRSRLRPT